ncbi:hypothetical protein EZ449_09845 [Pedobacter frigidisoli]|uniref:Uncharacterized protein n=1 Tax=Pedobacter frigidisoli TaxID=2530455 RepID=A0A4R0P122_9SPHI|nr:MmpS family transport accessory protein [Pedobacter frigidisoli]TCD10121.1 hypothetical protein EZ449_09845 [Pedobacter frigidisoli]
MKNTPIYLIFLFLLSSCSMSINSTKRGKLDIPKEETYTVIYSAKLSDGLVAKISYTNENSVQEEFKDVTRNWEKTVELKSGANVKLNTLAKGEKGIGEYKVTVNGKIVSEHILTNKRLRYSVDFDLP